MCILAAFAKCTGARGGAHRESGKSNKGGGGRVKERAGRIGMWWNENQRGGQRRKVRPQEGVGEAELLA